MVTVLRSAGLRIVIFSDDHEPAHVHVFGDGEAKIALVGEGAPMVAWNDGLKFSDLRRAKSVVAEHRDSLLARWRDMHG